MGIEVDDKQYPLVAIRVSGQIRDEEMSSYLAAMGALIDHARQTGRRAVHVIDARGSKISSAYQRQMMGAWMKAHDEANRQTCGGFAFVFDSAIIRGALTAVLWICPMPAPHRIFADVGEAMAWAREQADAAAPVEASSTVAASF